MTKIHFVLLLLVVYAISPTSFPCPLLAGGTVLTAEGIKFPDGTIQTTKAIETGIPGPQGPQGENGPQGPKGDDGFVSAIAPVPKTGQTQCYDVEGTLIPCSGTDQDGNLRRGFSWPNPRFSDNGDGTATDNLTGLVWLKNANCFGLRNWVTALYDCKALASGSCGLSDGSLAGDWRLPNVKELQSLIDFAYDRPALSNVEGTAQWSEGDLFSSVSNGYYWSSTLLPILAPVRLGV